MKKLLVGLLVLGSISVFSAELSEYERGFKDGVASVERDELWSCSVTVFWNYRNHTGVAEGTSRTIALYNLINNDDTGCQYISLDTPINECKHRARAGEAKCVKL